MYVDITFKIIVGLVSLLIVIRLLGKKELTQMTPFDFVYLILLGSFLEEGLFDDKISIFHIMYAIFLWGFLIFLIEKMVLRYDRFKRVVRGTPSDLIVKGKIDAEALKKNNMELDQLRTMIRSQGYFSITDIQHATLETGGSLSVLPKVKKDAVTPPMLHLSVPENETTYLFIDEGKACWKTIEKVGKSEKWLLQKLREHKIERVDDVYCAEWGETSGLYILRYRDLDNISETLDAKQNLT
ncbi:DUF421 domain-containing protein [Sporosarcina sp. PTS2304]|uniref:DUF421 domain-containing protein n=1 Tax=Sporosarcina sp. PTS2304 TaxID=2283194 RepID=UPI000E0DBB4A|nr:DUF421 domain-containing protein [Sporosarcina sp. PTS2304]AXH99150.1 DUF421 domain-containing protein [Sporosarcina sp. PTS2304]